VYMERVISALQQVTKISSTNLWNPDLKLLCLSFSIW
jgi:hypothetical protein